MVASEGGLTVNFEGEFLPKRDRVVGVGLGAVVKLGGKGSRVLLSGDSTTVLSWAREDTFNSKNALAPALILVELCSMFDLVVSKVDNEFWDSKRNVVCDSLSRGLEPPMGSCDPVGVTKPGGSGFLRGMIKLGHPSGVPADEEGFGMRFKAWREFLGRLEGMSW